MDVILIKIGCFYTFAFYILCNRTLKKISFIFKNVNLKIDRNRDLIYTIVYMVHSHVLMNKSFFDIWREGNTDV